MASARRRFRPPPAGPNLRRCLRSNKYVVLPSQAPELRHRLLPPPDKVEVLILVRRCLRVPFAEASRSIFESLPTYAVASDLHCRPKASRPPAGPELQPPPSPERFAKQKLLNACPLEFGIVKRFLKYILDRALPVNEMHASGKFLVFGAPLALTVMNLLWFGKIIKGLKKTTAKGQ